MTFDAVGRRSASALGLAALAAVLPTAARPQTPSPSPTPGDLERELPSLREAPGIGVSLPELPSPQPAGVEERLFPGFAAQDVQTAGAIIHAVSKGSGPPLLLIHGHPETHVTWHKVAPALADAFTVVVPDLRGYGDSSKPDYSPQSRDYSFRAMAQDMVELMARLGHTQFMVAGHDRGGRVVHRMMLDHPDAVQKGAVLDVAPTLTMYDDTSNTRRPNR